MSITVSPGTIRTQLAAYKFHESDGQVRRLLVAVRFSKRSEPCEVDEQEGTLD
jgi:hypothetical protein